MSKTMKAIFLTAMITGSVLVASSVMIGLNKIDKAISSKPEMARDRQDNVTGLIIHRAKNFTMIYTVDNEVRMREVAVVKDKSHLRIIKDIPPDKPMWVKWRGSVNEFGTIIAEYAEVHLHTNSVVQGSLKEE